MAETGKLKVIQKKNVFNKAVNNISKLLFKPSQRGLYGVYISLKRKDVLKMFSLINNESEDIENEKKESNNKKYEKSYEVYMKTIDNYITDYLYKRVKKQVSTIQENNVLSNYYEVINLKEKDYMEYKYKKQQLLLKVDYDIVNENKSKNLINNYKEFYTNRMEAVYKSLLKYFSVQLTDSNTNKTDIYAKIFETIQDYIQTVLIYKMENDKKEQYKDVAVYYKKLLTLEKFNFSKEQKDIKRKTLLLNISRSLFTHSLPLVAAEKCYIRLIKDSRNLIINTEDVMEREILYKEFIKLIEEYNCKLLSKKVYWDNQELKQNYKKFWDEYKKVLKLEEDDAEEARSQKEILFIKYDMILLKKADKLTKEINDFYIGKLKELKALRIFKNSFKIYNGKLIKKS